MTKSIYYEFGNATDVGCVRTKNEDSFVLYKAADQKQFQKRGHLALVCDGMGGARGGSTASTMAVETIGRSYYTSRSDDPRTAITQAIKEANSRINQRSRSEETLAGMGTTAVAAILLSDHAYIAHVGDSRCYFIRNKEIGQVTEDHTMVQKMVRQGLITSEQARNHPESHVLNRSVGVSPEVEIDLTMEPVLLQPGDILVLCSDGLSGPVMDDEIRQIAVANPAQHASEKLIELAKERGGPDNITVQIIRVHSQEPDEIGTTTMRLAPLRRGPSMWLVWVLIALFAAVIAFGALWYFDVIDPGSLFNSPGGDGSTPTP